MLHCRPIEQWWDQVWHPQRKPKAPLLVYKFDRPDNQLFCRCILSVEVSRGKNIEPTYHSQTCTPSCELYKGSHLGDSPLEAVAPNEDDYQGMFFNHKTDKDLRDESNEKNPLVFTPTSTL